MAKLTLNDIVSGYGTATLYNANNTLIEAALENTISRDGTAPNTMGAALDMNSHKINNVADGSLATDAVTLQQLQGITAVSTGSIPSQTGHTGKHLKTDGSVVSWDDVASTFMDTVLDDTSAAIVVETLRTDLAALAAAPADDDEVILRDTSVTTGKRNTVANFIKSILDTARTFTANHIFSGGLTFSGVLTFSAANTHSAQEVFSTAPLVAYSDAITGSFKNLLCFNAVANPTYQLTITADEILVRDTSGYGQLLRSFSETLDITASGANGLDTGAEASSTWYYIWAIAKADGTKDGLLSISSTAPTMPATYTYKALIGAWYNDGSSNLLVGRQLDKNFYYSAQQNVMTGGTATTETAVVITGVVPPTAKEFSFGLMGQTSGATSRTLSVRVVTALNYADVLCDVQGGTDGATNSSEITAPNIAQTLYYIWSGAGISTSSVDVRGFSL